MPVEGVAPSRFTRAAARVIRYTDRVSPRLTNVVANTAGRIMAAPGIRSLVRGVMGRDYDLGGARLLSFGGGLPSIQLDRFTFRLDLNSDYFRPKVNLLSLEEIDLLVHSRETYTAGWGGTSSSHRPSDNGTSEIIRIIQAGGIVDARRIDFIRPDGLLLQVAEDLRNPPKDPSEQN